LKSPILCLVGRKTFFTFLKINLFAVANVMLQVCAVFLVVFQIKAVAFLCTSRLAGLSLLHIRIAVNYFCLQEIISGHHYLNQNLFNFTINLEVALLLRQFLID